MIITFITKNSIPINGLITLTFPSKLQWQRDISTNHLIPINGHLLCYKISNNINNNTISCDGLYVNKNIVISNVFSA